MENTPLTFHEPMRATLEPSLQQLAHEVRSFYTFKVRNKIEDNRLFWVPGMAEASDGTLFVVSQFSHMVLHLGTDLTVLSEFGSFGSDVGLMDSPIGIAFAWGSVFVVDSGNERLQRFSEGVVQDVWSAERCGLAKGAFKGLRHLAFNGEHMFLMNYDAGIVYVLNEHGLVINQYRAELRHGDTLAKVQADECTGAVWTCSTRGQVNLLVGPRPRNWDLTHKITDYRPHGLLGCIFVEDGLVFLSGNRGFLTKIGTKGMGYSWKPESGRPMSVFRGRSGTLFLGVGESCQVLSIDACNTLKKADL